MTSREQMLQRVRKALARAPGGPSVVPEESCLSPANLAGVMPPIASDQLLPKFEVELEKVGGVAHQAAGREALEETLRQILVDSHSTAVVISRNPLLSELGLAEKLRAWGQSVATWPAADPSGANAKETGGEFRAASFEAQVGITGVDFALAETGSLILTSQTEGAMLSSLAPPTHVALFRRSQLFGSLDDVLERLPLAKQPGQPAPGRSVVFITGTSRTADIEQILIRGVHGPREVHAILLEDSCR